MSDTLIGCRLTFPSGAATNTPYCFFAGCSVPSAGFIKSLKRSPLLISAASLFAETSACQSFPCDGLCRGFGQMLCLQAFLRRPPLRNQGG